MSSLEPAANYHDLIRHDVFPVLPEYAGRLLDFGGGIGATSAELKRLGRANFIVVADQVAASAKEVDRFFAGNLEDENFVAEVISETGPFDTILALDIFEHLRDPWRVVSQLHNALSPSGVMVASIPNVNYHGLVLPLVFRGRYILADSGILDRTHIRWFTRQGAVELMSTSGLVIDEVKPNIISKRERLVDGATFGVFRRFLALQYVIRARRAN